MQHHANLIDFYQPINHGHQPHLRCLPKSNLRNFTLWYPLLQKNEPKKKLAHYTNIFLCFFDDCLDIPCIQDGWKRSVKNHQVIEKPLSSFCFLKVLSINSVKTMQSHYYLSFLSPIYQLLLKNYYMNQCQNQNKSQYLLKAIKWTWRRVP